MRTASDHVLRDTRRTLVGTGLGNALEWFDWSIYSIFAPFFAASFFPPGDKIAALLSTFAIFAVGFVARPVGAIIFGRLGDRIGRKTTLALTVPFIALGAFVIGASPTYEAVGVLASIILVVARLIQGLAYGGEQPAAGAYLAERAPAERRGMWSSLIYFSGTLGALAATLLGTIMLTAFGTKAMYEWGWRIPFIVAGFAGLYTLYMRRRMKESEQFAKTAEVDSPKPGLWRDMWAMRRSVLQVIGITVGLTVGYYYWGSATTAYSISVLGANPSDVLMASIGANLIFIALLPVWGRVSDRIGRRPVFLIGAIGLVVIMFPVSQLVDGNPFHLFIAMTIALIFLSAPCAISPATMAELFPTRVRTAGVAIPSAIAIALFGGTALYLQTWLSTAFGTWAFLAYVVVLLLVSTVTILRMPETRGKTLNDDISSFKVRR